MQCVSHSSVFSIWQQLADAGRKQLEQLMHQLQEQLQINLLQQTHLMQTNSNSEASKNNGSIGGGKPSQAMQQLQIQQQQLISQLQLVQQRLLMVSNRLRNKYRYVPNVTRPLSCSCSCRILIRGSCQSLTLKPRLGIGKKTARPHLVLQNPQSADLVVSVYFILT